MEVPAMSNTYQKRKASKEYGLYNKCKKLNDDEGNDSNLLIVFYVQIMPDDFVMQLHRF